MGYSAGGSSCGSGALVGAGEVEMAIGGDQGGSIRMPASFCGIYGMKPTHGLVPYTGMMPIEADHRSHRADDRQCRRQRAAARSDRRRGRPRSAPDTMFASTTTRRRSAAAWRACASASSREGFGLPVSERDVDQKVRKGAEQFRGARRHRRRSIDSHASGRPRHLDADRAGRPAAQMMHGNGIGFNWKGMYITSLLDAHANWRARANELSHSLKISMFVGEYFIRNYRGHFYAKAQNLARLLRKSYDDALAATISC